MEKKSDISRRSFLKQSAGILIAIPLSAKLSGCAQAGGAAVSSGEGEAPASLNALETAFVRVNADNTIVFFTPAAEFGNGSFQALPVIMAEQMDADWNNVSIEFSPSDDDLYAHPRPYFWGIMMTMASSSVSSWFDRLSIAGAQIRRILMQSAAESLGVDKKELSTQPGIVVHEASGRTMTYGEIAGTISFDGTLPKIRRLELKKPEDYRLISNPEMKRMDTPPKVRGEDPLYSIDVRRPGMLYATVKRAPFANRDPVSINTEEILTIKDVIAVNELPNAVAVVARTYEAAFKADRRLKIEWSNHEEDAAYNSDEALAKLESIAADLNREGLNVPQAFGASEDPLVDKTLAESDNVVERAYSTGFMYQAHLEPLNAVAEVSSDGGSVEMWAGSQAPTHLIRSVAKALSIPEGGVKLNRTFLGGAFGRRAAQDHDWAVDAALLSKIHKAPVKSIWTRESDLVAGRFRPITAQYIRAAIGSDGLISAYHQRTVADEGLRYSDPYRYEKGRQFPTISGITLVDKRYDFEGYKAEFLEIRSDVRVSPMRGIGHLSVNFARESFIDEVAHEQGIDPLAYRFSLLKSSEAGQEVIDNLREMSRWDGRPGLGAAMGYQNQGLVAEVALDTESYVVTVKNIWAAYVTGVVVQPDNAMNQLEGNLRFHIGGALTEEITFTNGKIDQTNLHDYRIARHFQSPNVEIRLLSSDGKPEGLGDAGNEVLAAAIANAFFSLTGKRIRTVPLTPAVVKEALA